MHLETGKILGFQPVSSHSPSHERTAIGGTMPSGLGAPCVGRAGSPCPPERGMSRGGGRAVRMQVPPWKRPGCIRAIQDARWHDPVSGGEGTRRPTRLCATEKPAKIFSNHWKTAEKFFQSLEKSGKIFQPLETFFPIIGKMGRFFQPLENFFPIIGKFQPGRKAPRGAGLASQLRGRWGVTRVMRLVVICRPRVLGVRMAAFAVWNSCWWICWPLRGAYLT